MTILSVREIKGKAGKINMAHLILLKAGKSIGGHQYFPNEKGEIVENLSVLNEWKGRLQVKARSYY